MSTRPRATRKLADQFAHRVVHKTYWAWVSGTVTPASGRWVDWMRKIPGRPCAEMVTADAPGAKEAILCYQVHQSNEEGSFVEIGAETGRMHQIRLQFAARGHPVWGDTMYGSSRPFGPVAEDRRQQWIALHAGQICFRHPETRQAITVVAPFPDCWPNAAMIRPAGGP
jgi:23S rRNA pseudouridine1911/1915/1917 synthase